MRRPPCVPSALRHLTSCPGDANAWLAACFMNSVSMPVRFARARFESDGTGKWSMGRRCKAKSPRSAASTVGAASLPNLTLLRVGGNVSLNVSKAS